MKTYGAGASAAAKLDDNAGNFKANSLIGAWIAEDK